MRIPRLGVLISVVTILVVGAAFLTNIVPYRQIVEQTRAVEEAQETLETLEAENRRLQEHLLVLDTPEELERLAREKLGYVRPGEIAYVVVDPPDLPDTRVHPDAGATETPEGLLDQVWKFVTGGDLLS